jgi:hyperosmotically inducible protein
MALALTASYAVAQTAATSSSPSTDQSTAAPAAPSSQSTASSTAAPANTDNQQILAQVQQLLSDDPTLKAVRATIDSKNEVTLQGSVGSKADRQHARDVAASIPGVKKVKDHLAVSASANANNTSSVPTNASKAPENTAGSIAGNTSASTGTANGESSTVGNTAAPSATAQNCPSGSCGTSDTANAPMTAANSTGASADHQYDIQHSIEQQISNSKVTVQQTSKDIVLTGTVTSEADRTRAESIAKQHAGGTTVVNQINVSTSAPMASSSAGETNTAAPVSSGNMSSASAADMQTQIQNALQQQGLSGVMVNVTDTSIDLSGTVPSGKDRTTALRVAQSYAANRRVTDHLTVSGPGAPSGSMGTGSSTSGTDMTPSPSTSSPNTPAPNGNTNPPTPPEQNIPH